MLGDHFDIHTGGVDHRTLHHINEIAQAEALLRSRGDNVRWVPWWLHNEFLIMRDGKMSKSTGSFVTLDDVVAEGIHPIAYRWFLLAAHYRSQIEFSMQKIAESGVALRRIIDRFARAGVVIDDSPISLDAFVAGGPIVAGGRDWAGELVAAAANDLATPELVALTADFSKAVDQVAPDDATRLLSALQWLLGIPFATLAAGDLETVSTQAVDADALDALASERDLARSAKDWDRADAIRAQMELAGAEVRDTPTGTVWSPR
jgi:cysteinyl-tRNA synthetase